MDEATVLSDLDQLRSRYDVLRRMGDDGGTPVYAVRSRETERHFLVSVMERPGSGSAGAANLYLWQAHTMAPLAHPGLIPLHAIHHLQDGAVAVAMDRRRGRTLAERMAAGPMGAPEAERILREVAEALEYLHGRGIVHRRVSPHAIFLDRDARRARLACFGILRNAVADDDGLIAPELIGRSGAIDERKWSPRADVYALGRVARSMFADEGAPEQVEAAIVACLEPNPRRRIGRGGELLGRLDGATARTPRRLQIGGRTSKQAAAAVVAVVLAGAVWSTAAPEPTPRAASSGASTVESQTAPRRPTKTFDTTPHPTRPPFPSRSVVAPPVEESIQPPAEVAVLVEKPRATAPASRPAAATVRPAASPPAPAYVLLGEPIGP